MDKEDVCHEPAVAGPALNPAERLRAVERHIAFLQNLEEEPNLLPDDGVFDDGLGQARLRVKAGVDFEAGMNDALAKAYEE